MARRRRPTLAAIRDNPTLHPRAFALVQERFPDLEWHLHAQSPDSSQAFALSAFLPLLEFPDRDRLLGQFVEDALPWLPHRPERAWRMHPEYSDPVLLGESGRGEATSVDILLVADDAVVCVECKFRVDARLGWGRCGQPPRLCEGFHGAGSDRKGTAAACRLEIADGHRGPRHYWRVAREHFRDEVLAPQRPGDVCPFLEVYQLVRNYLFAARYAQRAGLEHFGVIGLAPEASRLLKRGVSPPGRAGHAQDENAGRSGPLAEGIERFRQGIVRPEGARRVALASYERYVDILSLGSPHARDQADFLAGVLGGPHVDPSCRLQKRDPQ